jgi:septum formation inhibitor-activating ATPase MinD
VPDKTMFILNRVEDERTRAPVTIRTEAIEKHLKRKVEARIPNNEQVVLSAVNKGVPVVATAAKDRGKSPIKELMDLSDHIFNTLMRDEMEDQPTEQASKERKIANSVKFRLGRT